MSPAGVYAHFSSKEEVLYRLSLAGHADVRDLVVGAAAASEGPVDQLCAIVADFVAWHARFHTTARVVQYEMAALTPAHAEVIAVLRRETQSTVREVLDAGVAAGVFAVGSPRAVARAIVSLGIDVARWYDPSGVITPEAIGDEYAELALRMAGYHAM
jgi:AcrR family transcriptional regulator